MDYFSDEIADKVSKVITNTSSTNGMQNGFQAIQAASNNLNMGGSKKNKTRKFRLSKPKNAK